MVGTNYDQATDSHLAKKYNDALFDCMMRSNLSGFVSKSSPHIDNLVPYHAAVETFFNNTFFLFESIIVKTDEDDKKKLTMLLMELNNEIEEDIRKIKTNPQLRTASNFHNVSFKISYMHKMIMFGLQQRQMLVRMSDREPRGVESINYWNTKLGFKKGNLKLNQNEIH